MLIIVIIYQERLTIVRTGGNNNINIATINQVFGIVEFVAGSQPGTNTYNIVFESYNFSNFVKEIKFSVIANVAPEIPVITSVSYNETISLGSVSWNSPNPGQSWDRLLATISKYKVYYRLKSTPGASINDFILI